MTMSKRKDAEVHREVRAAVAKDPMISLRRLQQVLYDRGLRSGSGNHLSLEYINRTANRVHTIALRDVDDIKINERIAASRERFALTIQRLSKIAYWEWNFLSEGIPMPTVMEQNVALKLIVELDLKLLSAEMDAGIFKRDLGSLEINRRNVPIGDEKRAQIISAMQSWGLLPQAPLAIPEITPTPVQVIEWTETIQNDANIITAAAITT